MTVDFRNPLVNQLYFLTIRLICERFKESDKRGAQSDSPTT